MWKKKKFDPIENHNLNIGVGRRRTLGEPRRRKATRKPTDKLRCNYYHDRCHGIYVRSADDSWNDKINTLSDNIVIINTIMVFDEVNRVFFF